jgi:hypothetical protein
VQLINVALVAFLLITQLLPVAKNKPVMTFNNLFITMADDG